MASIWTAGARLTFNLDSLTQRPLRSKLEAALDTLPRHLRAAGAYPMAQGRLAISAAFAEVIARRLVPITSTAVGANSLPPTPRRIPASPAAPTTVDAVPAGVILRTGGLSVSATWTLPPASTATPSGWLNRAALPAPSARQ